MRDHRALLTACLTVLLTAARIVIAAEPPDLADRESLEAFFDGVIEAQLEAHDVPGATLSVVKDGEVLLAKGYGWADARRTEPVDAQRTLFRPGSVSKLFTWTAVMQLVERGELDLDTDVNEYVTQFQIPATFAEPVTLRDLLTHTPGFEDGAIGYLFVDDEGDLVPLAESLAAHIPARVRPPGKYAAYSNWGAALAGLIVADVSGMDYETYVDRNILQPLEMAHSTFREPLPDDLAPDMSDGLVREQGLFQAQGFEFISNFGPAGALSSSGADMAHFMIAHLQNGRFGEARILKTETAERMHSRLFAHDPRLPGMAYGFYEERINGRRLIAHGGDTLWFHSNLILLPAEGVGVFVSFNAPAGGRARSEMAQVFMDQYFPAPRPEPVEPPADFEQRAAEYAGAYRPMRRSYTRFEKVMALAGDLMVGDTGKGRLLLIAGNGPADQRQLVEVGEDLFRNVDDEGRVAFGRDANGRVTHLFVGSLPFIALDKLAWWQTARLHQLVLAFGLLVSLAAVLGGLWNWRRWFAMSRGEKLTRCATFGASACFVAAVVTLVAAVAPLGNKVVFGYPGGVSVALALTLAGAVLTVAALIMTVPAWIGGYWTVFARVRHTLLVALLTAVTLSLYFWNAIGWWNL